MQHRIKTRTCEHEGCEVRYTPVSSNQKFCTDHAYLARAMRAGLAPRVCSSCSEPFVPVNTEQVLCGERCRRAAEKARLVEQRHKRFGKRTCACGETFLPLNAHQKRCNGCVSALHLNGVQKPSSKVPCIGCRHGKAQPQADLGVECVAGLWLRCQPLTVARLREEA